MNYFFLKQLVFSFVIIISSSTGYAEHKKEADFYLLYGMADYEDDLVSGLDPTGLVIRFLPVTDRWFGYEGRLGLGISEGKDNIDSSPGSGEIVVDVHTIAGLYLNAHSSISDVFLVYGVAGVTWVRYDLEFDGTRLLDAEDESGFAYGFGVDIGKHNGMRFNLEFMQYLDKSDFDLSAVSVGVSF